MLGTYQQHRHLLDILSNHTVGQEVLVQRYKDWIEDGRAMAWPEQQKAWEETGYALLTLISEAFGASMVHVVLGDITTRKE